MAKDTAVVETPTVETPVVEPVARGRIAEPFGRDFQLRLRFHNDLSGDAREAIVSAVMTEVTSSEFNSKRFTRGEANEDQQTWRIAETDYIWPEQVEPAVRGIRIPAGPIADMIKALAAKNGISPDAAFALILEKVGK
jgi:hypothetical protein